MKNFDEIPISTSTIIGIPNINLNLENLFNNLPVVNIDPNDNITYREGDIILINYNERYRGYHPKMCKTNYFRNTLTVVIFVKNKKQNVKIFTTPTSESSNKIQQPGCKHINDCITTFCYLWKHIYQHCQYTILNNEKYVSIILQIVMSNVNFNINFSVNREKLDKIINQKQINPYNSIMQPNFGHTGVNITAPITDDVTNFDMDKYIIDEFNLSNDNTYPLNIQICQVSDSDKNNDYIKNNNYMKIYHTKISFNSFLNTLHEKEKNRQLQLINEKTNTFLVFYSGKVIMSGFIPKFMKTPYTDFCSLLERLKPEIEETNL